MLKIAFIALAFALSPLVQAQTPVSIWGQCGGIGFTGSTTCATGAACVYQNPYYSQCIPGATVSSTITSHSSSSTVSSSTVSSSTPASPPPPASTGFVKTSGQKFMLNGAEFTVVGENSYWVGLMGYSAANIDKAFSDIESSGSTVVRTWGFNEVTPSTQQNYPIYYQSWNGATPTVNTGANGLQNFDQIISSAKAHGLRLIVALTNNWSDYGGMDVYVNQILGSTSHDLFYTNAQVIAAFKNYIKAFVSRYVNEPTILGWELSNEPRCAGSTGTTSGTCTTATITNWISEISAYIKSIDPNHLVAVGDEGFFNEPGNPSYPYQGGEGIDFNVNLNISTIDFGTFHLYPESWGQSANPSSAVWGSQWISDHATSQKAANKPVIGEEFGVTSDQTDVYTAWYNTIVSSGLAGDLIWQAGSHLSTGDTPQDGYAEYPDGAVFPIIQKHAAALKARG
ncbi:glycoside hydrolase family 5 protein [Phanerochaete sordida]|uniref:mannan endo-1,4-beta-mannosidase n=1 Tax=Phanerochaete sordida TaxID=48140 RepID=A0A9P3GMT5_9APHY|nr:glycoside hydrolase family 5 protein [Phanerochaete sordida]